MPEGLSTVQNGLHPLAHRIAPGRCGLAKQGVKHRLGDHVLGQHLNGVVFGDLGVEVVSQFFQERLEHLPLRRASLHQSPDAGNVGLGDAGHVVGPVLPIAFVAAFLYHRSCH